MRMLAVVVGVVGAALAFIGVRGLLNPKAGDTAAIDAGVAVVMVAITLVGAALVALAVVFWARAKRRKRDEDRAISPS